MKLETSVSTISLVIAPGGEVNGALLIDAAYEVFGFPRRTRVDVAFVWSHDFKLPGEFSEQRNDAVCFCRHLSVS
jgi:hypothetical protein